MLRFSVAAILLCGAMMGACDDADEKPISFDVKVLNKEGININYEGKTVRIRFGESIGSVKKKLPECDEGSGSLGFYQLGFDFTKSSIWGTNIVGLDMISIHSPEYDWFYTDRYRLKTINVGSGLRCPDCSRADVVDALGKPDEVSDKKDRYLDLGMSFRFEDNGDFHYMYVDDE